MRLLNTSLFSFIVKSSSFPQNIGESILRVCFQPYTPYIPALISILLSGDRGPQHFIFDQSQAPRSASSYIGSYVIQSSNLLFAPQKRFNCLNKPVSAHPSLYGTQVRPYLFTSLSEGLRPPSVLPLRSCDPCLALRCSRTCR